MIKLHIAAPNIEPIKEDVKRVTVKLIDGEVELLPGHIDFISLIKDGFVQFSEKRIDIKEGVVHFEDGQLYITYFQ